MGVSDVLAQFRDEAANHVICNDVKMDYENGGATQVFSFVVAKKDGSASTTITATCTSNMSAAITDAVAQAVAWAA